MKQYDIVISAFKVAAIGLRKRWTFNLHSFTFNSVLSYIYSTFSFNGGFPWAIWQSS